MHQQAAQEAAECGALVRAASLALEQAQAALRAARECVGDSGSGSDLPAGGGQLPPALSSREPPALQPRAATMPSALPSRAQGKVADAREAENQVLYGVDVGGERRAEQLQRQVRRRGVTTPLNFAR